MKALFFYMMEIVAVAFSAPVYRCAMRCLVGIICISLIVTATANRDFRPFGLGKGLSSTIPVHFPFGVITGAAYNVSSALGLYLGFGLEGTGQITLPLTSALGGDTYPGSVFWFRRVNGMYNITVSCSSESFGSSMPSCDTIEGAPYFMMDTSMLSVGLAAGEGFYFILSLVLNPGV